MKLAMFAFGNPSRGDDAVGPWFADRFRHLESAAFTLVEAFQLQVEHLLDCREADLLLFVDACCDGEDFRFAQIAGRDGMAHTSHQLAPDELLGYYPRVFHEEPPPAFELAVPGHDFELGQAMSAPTLACCERAARVVADLLATPQPGEWCKLVEGHAQGIARA